MPDGLEPGVLAWLLPVALVAGFVRGFTGFGTALVYVPLASRVVSPAEAVVSLLFMDILSTIVLTRGALRVANRPEALRLAAGGLLGVPVGVWLLTVAEPTLFRWLASAMALGLLPLLAGGFRYDGPRGPALTAGVGATSGVMGGFAAMAGPPVILYYLTGRESAATIRANIILFFAVLTVMSFAMFAAFGLLAPATIALGLALTLPFAAATWAGARLFRLRGDALFRRAAYLLVAVAALGGLPVFD